MVLYAQIVLKGKQVQRIGKNLKMDEEYKKLLKENRTMMAKLAVRQCQYKIAVEGLKTIVESNDPMNIAEKTLTAMDDCIP